MKKKYKITGEFTVDGDHIEIDDIEAFDDFKIKCEGKLRKDFNCTLNKVQFEEIEHTIYGYTKDEISEIHQKFLMIMNAGCF